MNIPSWAEPLLKQEGALKYIKRNKPQTANPLMPLTTNPRAFVDRENFLFADDPRALRLTEALATRLTKEFPTDALPSGYAGPSAVPGDFYSLLNVSGCGMNPLPLPVTNNAAMLETNGLTDAIRPTDKPWLVEIVRLFFSAAAPANVPIRKAASFSFPFFTTHNVYKKTAIMSALDNIDDFLRLACGGPSELKELLEKYHGIYLYAIQERQQPDAIILKDGVFTSKPRFAPTEEEARSGKATGSTVADKAAYRADGTVIDGHFGMRRRDVFAFNGNLNYVMSCFMSSFRTVYADRFAFTYKHRGSADKETKARNYKFTVGCDVKTMDKMFMKSFVDVVFEEMENYLDERVVTVMRRAFQATYACRSPWAETSKDYNPFFGPSPFSAEFTNFVGLPSGIAPNPDFGKLWMTFVYVILYRDAGALRHPTELESFLQGRNRDHALLDMSDDATFLTNSPVVAAKLRDPKSPYAVLGTEVPVIFLGDVFASVGGQVRAYPNPVTYAVNMLCREDSVERRDGNTLKSWADGQIARQEVYSRTPIFRDLNAIMGEEFRKHVGINPLVLARSLSSLTRMTDVDAIVRENPAALFYKVDERDVSPSVLDEIATVLPAADVWPRIRHLFKVPTTDYVE